VRPWVLIFAFLAGGAVVPLLVPTSKGGESVSAALSDFVYQQNAEEGSHGADSIGESREGRSLNVEDLGQGPIRVYVVGGVHGEPPALRPTDELLAFFQKPSTKKRLTVRMLEDLNPDGTARGLFCNANQVDIDRNFPSNDFSPSLRHGMSPLSEPETQAFWQDVLNFEPDLVVVLQSALAGPFLDGDGPSDAYGMQFVRGAASVDDRWTLLGDQGYAFSGSLGSALGKDRGIPVLNLRLRRDQDALSVKEALLAGFDALAGSSS
jgi:protein MpaA